MPGQPDLSDIQAWLHTFVVEPGDQAQALRAAENKAGFTEGSAESLILPSPTLSPRERIQIYRGMYLLRMQEALEIDFPTIQWYVGEQVFKDLVARYVQKYPSNSYTLDHLGRHFSKFLEEHDPNGLGKPLGELARLEWSLCSVAIAHDAVPITMVDLASVPEEQFLNLHFRPVHALEILNFDYNVNQAYKAWSSGEEPIELHPAPTHVVCWRHELKVWRMELSEASHCFLRSLIDGITLGQSIDCTLERYEETEETLFEDFQNWLKEGFFASFSRRRE